MRQRRSLVKKESKLCQHSSSIKTENDLKTSLELIKTESEAPSQSTHEFTLDIKIFVVNLSNRKINFILLDFDFFNSHSQNLIRTESEVGITFRNRFNNQ